MENPDHTKFHFRDIHPNIYLGTTSDRYAGWIGQIYSKERYVGRINRRTNVIGGKKFIEEVLPVDSVKEYFNHFRVLEIDYTFYRPLTELDGTPTQNYQLLTRYHQYMKEGGHLILKVPQMVSAQKFHRGKEYIPNPDYLNPEIFTNQFINRPWKYWVNPLPGLFLNRSIRNLLTSFPKNNWPVRSMLSL